MIASTAALRIAHDPIPHTPPNPDFPGDDGWMGQVPPPDPPKSTPAAPSLVDEPVTGFESRHDARENGWLGQVPPPTATSGLTTPTTTAHDAAFDLSPSTDRFDDGWLGQVPPSAPAVAKPEPAVTRPTYANEQLAPEPWKSDPGNDWSDPTLFG